MNYNYNKLTPRKCRSLFIYNKKTGELSWRHSRGGMPAGAPAGSVRDNKYIQISVDGSMYRAHRIVWAMHNGRWPAKDIDHRNGVRSDNRIKNLRLAGRTDNSRNASIRTDNTSGFSGVSFMRSLGKYEAYINIAGKKKCLGYFSTKEAAVKKRRRAERELFGAFAPSRRQGAT